MAQTRKVESAEKLMKYIDDFIKYCEENDEIPSNYNLCKFLAATLSRYEAGEGNYRGYEIPFKNLRQYREHRLLTMLEGDSKKAAAAIFQLKQPFNGGYVESTQQVDQGATVTLKIEGVGGVDAFK